MVIIEKNRDSSRFQYIDNVEVVAIRYREEEMERRRKYLADIKVIVHSIRDNMRKQRMTIRKENRALKEDLTNAAAREDQEDLAAKGHRYIKEAGDGRIQ